MRNFMILTDECPSLLSVPLPHTIHMKSWQGSGNSWTMYIHYHLHGIGELQDFGRVASALNWHLTTNKDLRPGRYNGPRIAADAVARYYPRDRYQKKVIDIAAGTGFVAENLKARGFQHIDALEPSASMIAMAKKKGLYETYYENMLNDDPLNIETDTYDCAVSCGGFGEGHIPCAGIKELIRITKPGGIVCIVMRQCYLIDVEEYKDRLVPFMISLENTGMWTRVSRHVVQDYFIDLPGVVFLYTVQ
ncbi:methyltransferase-like protein 27 [Haliotis rubra]|uniref:methyltransferase-like protein 27 n=1 Tax=Haliotis rubra TaxID=36100 RepID=UPI001EE5ED91|nr:methyltransferase-like protein 27 [Haliotis rubra]